MKFEFLAKKEKKSLKKRSYTMRIVEGENETRLTESKRFRNNIIYFEFSADSYYHNVIVG